MLIRNNKAKLAITAAIIAIFVTSLLILGHFSATARHITYIDALENSENASLVSRTSEIYSVWKKHGAKGRVVIHLGKFLHFVELDGGEGYRASAGYPVRVETLQDEYERGLSYQNFLWVAMQGNVVREIYNVLPPATFQEKLKALETGNGGVAKTSDRFITHYYGSRRIFMNRLPRRAEPVLLNVDASYAAWGNPAAFVEMLRGAGLKADVITLCLAQDNPDVTETDRRWLMEVGRLLGATPAVALYGIQ